MKIVKQKKIILVYKIILVLFFPILMIGYCYLNKGNVIKGIKEYVGGIIK